MKSSIWLTWKSHTPVKRAEQTGRLLPWATISNGNQINPFSDLQTGAISCSEARGFSSTPHPPVPEGIHDIRVPLNVDTKYYILSALTGNLLNASLKCHFLLFFFGVFFLESEQPTTPPALIYINTSSYNMCFVSTPQRQRGARATPGLSSCSRGNICCKNGGGQQKCRVTGRKITICLERGESPSTRLWGKPTSRPATAAFSCKSKQVCWDDPCWLLWFIC